MRLNEAEQVKKDLTEHLGIALTVVDASSRFLQALKGVVEPETKRRIIGHLFIEVFEEEAIRIEKEAVDTPNAGKVEWVSADLTLYLTMYGLELNSCLLTNHSCSLFKAHST